MGMPDLLERPSLPQLVAISHFHISEAAANVVLKRVQKKLRIGSKRVRLAPIPAMQVAEQNELGGVVEVNGLGGLEDL